MTLYDRHLPLEGSYNIRDLGGYLTADGQRTRWRTLLRADALHQLTADSQRQLLELGLRTVIDLRFPHEVTSAPNVFANTPGVKYIHISLFPTPESPNDLSAYPPSLDIVYRMSVDTGTETIKAVFDALTAPDAFPAVFHCTAGKDRTGIIAALVLGVLGVPHSTITEDFALTGQYTAVMFEGMRAQMAAAGVDLAKLEPMLASNPELMQAMLDHLDAQYHGIRAYLTSAGVTEAQIEALRAALLEAAM